MSARFGRRRLLGGLSGLGAAGILPGCASDDEASDDRRAFLHGVASGDPKADSVLLWTRVTREDGGEVAVRWEVSASPEFSDLVASGEAIASAARDHTVKVDVTGLAAATTYYYRFEATGERSPIGRTRTAPEGATPRLRFAVCSCASYAQGYFHAYRNLAARRDLDAVLHLGDYVYEHGDGEYGDVRGYDPPHEIVTLDDYRRRYAHYRRDPDLQEVHRQHPFVCVWDDHELANNAYDGGAENHTEGAEGTFADRRAAAARAHAEWMPLRESADGTIHRALAYGDLAELVLLDTRLEGRSKQVASEADPALDDPARTLLGIAQETWLADTLMASKARYKLLGQQVVMAQLAPVFNPDAWDGYPQARERFFDVLEEGAIADVVVLTGDVHSSFAAELVRAPHAPDYDATNGTSALAVELVTPGITSPGFPPGLSHLADGLVADNPHLRYAEVVRRGYLLVELTHARLHAGWYLLDDVVDPSGATESLDRAFTIEAGTHRFVAVDAFPPGPSDAPALAPAE